MKIMAVAVAVLVSFSAVGAAAVPAGPMPAAMAVPALLGPHPVPAPGAVLEEFPAKVHAWHGRGMDKEGNEVLLHKSSHIFLVGPDGNWVDGIVHVGEAVDFYADFPSKLAPGKYTARTTAHWSDGLSESEYEWSFTLKKAEGAKNAKH